MIPDLIDMIQWVLDSEGGSCSIQFGSNTFAYAWTIEKIGDMLKVDVDDEVAAIQGSPILDDRCKHFEVSSDEFLAEWKSLLEKILSTVEESEVKIDNPSQTETIKRLIGRIGVSGIMYR